MAFTWNPELETGYATIDMQHKELIKTINDLLTACQQGYAADKVNQTIDFLLSYTKKHFGEEEALQQKSHYPDYTNHRQYHQGFVKVVMELSAELKQSGPNPAIVIKIIRNVGDWLFNHIQQEDKKVTAHLKQTGV